MEKFKSKLSLRNILLLITTLITLVGFIMYIIVSTTGYFVGKAPNMAVTIFSILFIVGSVAFIIFDDKIKKYDTIAFFLLAACLILSIIFFILDKEEVVGEMLIPVNHPQKQIEAAITSIVAIVIYLVGFITFAVSTFLDNKKKA